MTPSARKQQGATLLEALVAVLIFSIGILAVVAMQAVSVRTVSDARYRADASFMANQAIGRLWGDPANLAAHAEADVDVAQLPNGKRTVAINGDRATVTIRWQLPGDAEHQFVAEAWVNVGN
ncbi:MAG: prepilin-type N-terminal cleavage/methylation domain-containing protein [Burkholderiaceae bacterium]|nr:prepilin-type N-terminal cleavage/methylation domain-containing protein [Burkholderiaceae bacterium]MEB2351812.1 prepilin-type N-terminal cleavage/methylation domain-containing protein [Burkholderiaceae bacterium]